MTVYETPFRTSARPTIDRSPPKRSFQYGVLRITTGVAPCRSSSGENVRPTTGFTSRIGKNAAETIASRTRSGSPWPVRLKLSLRNAAMLVNERARWLQSRKFG